jgi:hypothetical protein
MAAIIIAVKKRIANERRQKQQAEDVGRCNQQDDEQALLDRLPPQEFRELDIELGMLQLGCIMISLL